MMSGKMIIEKNGGMKLAILMHNMAQIEQWLAMYTKSTPKDFSRMASVLDRYDHPELKTPAIHVTGTNGKGSTCRYIEQMATDHGYSTLLFTSPHLTSLTERIRHNKENIDDQAFIQLMNEVRHHIEALNIEAMSYFEVLTLAFFIYAGQVDVDILIIEVGIGGKKDYTNILPHAVRVITSIGKDHIPSLGKDEFAITKQKAGIMHQGDTMVVGEIAPEYLAIIQDKVTQKEGQLISYKLQPQMDIPQLGFYQVWNARTAYAAFAAFTKENGLYFNQQTAIAAIQVTALPGRMELIANQPATYIDGAHNISAIKVLVEALKTNFADKRIIMYFSSLDRKEINNSLDYIQAHSDIELYVTTFDYEEARKEDDYLATTDAKFVNNWYDDYKQSAPANVDAVVVFCGSFYFISEVREKLQSEDIYENSSNF